ncbi:MAG: hypothetical protein LBU62_07855 [Bacteroidales bacterium]|jgi:hypothetical protein|nr:hypothetical protein [Bacteroidales bacterium]
MNNINNFTFVDCVLINFSVDHLLSTLIIETEAYFPVCNSKRNKGRIQITFNNISKINLSKLQEFDFDLQSNSDKDFETDTRANEVYSIESKTDDNKINVNFVSDFLKFNLMCSYMDIKSSTNN